MALTISAKLAWPWSLRIEGGIEPLDHVPDRSLVDPGFALGLGEQANRTLEQFGRRVGGWWGWCVLGLGGLGCFFGAGGLDQAVVVTELVAALGPVLVGVLAGADADQGATGSLDLLGDGHEVAVAADDDDGADVGEAADVFGGVEAELDIGTVLGRCPRWEELDQFDGALQQGIAGTIPSLPMYRRNSSSISQWMKRVSFDVPQ